MFIMWSNTITALCTFMALLSLNVNAETQNYSPALNASMAVNQSNPQLIYQQALNYLLGRNGASKSAEKAASLFKTLAEQNWSSAQHMLGNMYMRGKGVEKNDLLAYKWLSLASKNNLQLASVIHGKRRLLHKNLQNSLSLESLKKLELWIAEWKPSYQSTTRLN
jgi:TPR repeat protein